MIVKRGIFIYLTYAKSDSGGGVEENQFNFASMSFGPLRMTGNLSKSRS